MKKLCFVICALLVGCSTPDKAPSKPQPQAPPLPPGYTPKTAPKPLVRKVAPRAASAAPMLGAGAHAAPPSWTFNDLNGIYQIDASTNLIDWWPMIVVYHVTNVTITSDTVDKRPMLFFRVQPATVE